jgi:hypothetical protein
MSFQRSVRASLRLVIDMEGWTTEIINYQPSQAAMARKSLRSSGVTAPRSSSKRPNPSDPAVERITPPKRGKTSVSKATAKRSTYFARESPNNESEESEASPDELSNGSEDFRASPSSEEEEEVESDFEDEDGEVSQTPQKKTKTPSKQKSSDKNAHVASTSDLWRPGVKTGLGPGTQVVIQKPKARDAGSTPYTDERIHPNTMLFLKDLAANNDREWLKSEFL